MSIIIMLLLLSLLIIVHEAGHFIAAKSFGIKVDKFGFGLPLGPTLFEKKSWRCNSFGSCIVIRWLRFICRR